MSFKKKNWTALSSLAQQWSAEDEEEQERERRRRHRQHGSLSEVKEGISIPYLKKQNAPQSLAQQWREEDKEEHEREHRQRQRHRQHGSISEEKEEMSSPDSEKQNAVNKAPQSFTQHWRSEDGEEQQREHRQRHRQHGSIFKVKEELSSPEKHNTLSQALQRFCSNSEAKPSKQRNSKQESERISTNSTDKEEEDRSVRRRIEIFNNVQQEKKETVSTRKFGKEKMRTFSLPAQVQKVPVMEKCECLHQEKGPPEERKEDLSQEEKEVTLKKQNSLDQVKKERILIKHEKLVQKVKEPQVTKDEVFRDEENTPNTHTSPKLAAFQNDVAAKQPQRASWERRSISRLEVKIQPRIRNTAETAAPTTSSRPQVTEKSIPKSTNAAENCHSERVEPEASVFVSRPLVTYSSSFKRIAPRTISFRVVSRKDKQDDLLLSRSASMRLPVNAGKLDEKLERYTSAVQRSGSIKLPPSARKNFQPPLEGVASKRSIFEANVSSRAEPSTLIRKESLKLPGGVTSRINLWISRTQEASQDEDAKEVRRTDATSQQNQWRKQSDDS